MPHEFLNAIERVWTTAARLHGQPFIDHQRFVLPSFKEGCQGLLAFTSGRIHQGTQRCKLVGHVVSPIELHHRQIAVGGVIEFVQIGETQIAQTPSC